MRSGGERRRRWVGAARGLGVAILLAGGIVHGCRGPASVLSPQARSACPFRPLVVFTGSGEPASPAEDAAGAREVRWLRPADPEARAELDALCQEVGPPIVVRSAPSEEALVDELVVVSWNVHMERGRVSELVRDLRSGRLTGAPVRHFVLLLQEVARVGHDGAGPAGGLVEFARRWDLHAFYVPSVPEPWPTGAAAADRGNAILSTLSLSGLEALELPVQRQRRVAVAATVRGAAARGDPWKLRVVSVHLENRSRWTALHRSLGQDRVWQAARLVAALEDEDRIVVGGDFNTWFGGRGEEAARLMADHFPSACEPPEGATIDIPFVPDLTLDHVFFRLPRPWWASYEVLADAYGSDHKPLVARIRFDRPVRCPGPSGTDPGGLGEPPKAGGLLRPSRPATASRRRRP